MDEQHTQHVEAQRILYNLLPAMFFVIDGGGIMIEVSDHCLQALGYARTEVIGRSSMAFLTETSRQRLAALNESVRVETSHLKEVTCEFVKKNGEIVSLLLSATAARNEQGEIAQTLVVLTDTDQRTQAQRMLREILEGTASYTGGDFFRSLVSHVAQAFQVCYAMITECTDHTLTRVRTLACYKYHNFLEQFEYSLAGGPCQGVIEGGVCHYPRLRELFPREDQYSYLGVPVHDSRGNVLGHLVIEDDKPMHPGPYDVDILKLFAARAGAELERKRAEEVLRERERQLQQLNERLADTNRSLEAMVATRTQEIERRRQVAESLRDMVLILNSERPLAEILDYIVTTASRLLGTESGALLLLQEDRAALSVQNTYGLQASDATEVNLPVNRTLLEQAILNRQPVVISNLAAVLSEHVETEDATHSTPPAAHHQTLLAVPLIRQNRQSEEDELYGGITLYYPERRQFSDEEIELAVAFGAQAALAIENAQLRRQAQLGAILEERARLARELHDSVTQQLYSLTLLAEGWRRMVHSGRLEQVEEALAELGQLGQQSLKEMRLLIHELRSPALEQDGLLGALHERLAAVERRSGVEARLIATDLPELPAAVEAGLHRIAQEALNNILKHAAATTVTVQLRTDPERVILEIIDNGRGFDLNQAEDGGGAGLANMRERARRLGGDLTICSAPDEGTTVRVVLLKGDGNRD